MNNLYAHQLSLAKVTEFQLEKLFGKNSEAKSFIQQLIRGYLDNSGHVGSIFFIDYSDAHAALL